MRRKELAPANAVLIGLALIVAAASLVNGVSALLNDAVWVLSARGVSITRVERLSDPFSFWIILLVPPVLAAYLVLDIWRRPPAL